MNTLQEMGYSSLDSNEVVFPNLGIDVHVEQTAFTVFGIDIQWYGILIVTGLLLAMVFAYRNMRRVGIDADRATDVIIGGIIGSFIGARAYYVIFNWSQYKDDPAQIFNVRGGGLAIFGGLIGAILVGYIVSRFRKVAALPMLDLCGVGFLIGQGIGRWGNFVNQEAFGCNTNSLFGMSGGRVREWILMNYPTGKLADGSAISADVPVHPCFLYESVWCLTGAAVLALVLHKFRKFDGQIFLMYLIWYGGGRFVIEGLRTDSLMLGTMRVSQVLAILLCVTAMIVMLICLSTVKRMGREYVLYVNTKESRALLAEADKRFEEEAARRAEKKAARKAQQSGEAEKILPDDDAEESAAEQEDAAETEDNT